MIIDKELKQNYINDFMLTHRIGQPVKTDFHFHDQFEVFYNLTDGTHCYINDQSYTLKKGDLVLINNMDIHLTQPPLNIDLDRYVLMFTPELVNVFSTSEIDLLDIFINKCAKSSQAIHLHNDQSLKLISLLDDALYHHKNRTFGYQIYRRIKLIEILLLISSFFHSDELSISHTTDNDTRAIKPILQYIKTYLNDELCLEHLAQTFHFNKFYLSRLFKKTTGTTLNNYIINLRLLKARELLKKNFSITEVCEMVGFNSYTYFISTFTKNIGISPKKYSMQEWSKI
ncbi:AraC family transcriptional regulator [Clostridium lacusfryxellense]|uniref:AraC family transcriptional regulator n=1 Tax=Clostridium lacusfryxellense TaxID=205328 RepID=UPI001C0A9E28|nr:AraC family transcriptional regulator [Clostridium lacusfryxellense]MBU3110064.1 AraC family transcriptional regulator [Clostridium lacusfryxellense]